MPQGRDWEDGYDVGFAAGVKAAHRADPFSPSASVAKIVGISAPQRPRGGRKGKQGKRRQSPKQKLLSTMADKAWKSYKRNYPKGKKTYITIRAQVSRSQLYKRKAKRL